MPAAKKKRPVSRKNSHIRFPDGDGAWVLFYQYRSGGNKVKCSNPLIKAVVCFTSLYSFSTFAEDWTYSGDTCTPSKIMSAHGLAACDIVKEVVGSALTNVWIRVDRYTLDNPASCFFFLTSSTGANTTYAVTNLPNTTAAQSVKLTIPDQTGMNDGYAQVYCSMNQYDEIKSIRVQQLN